MGINLCSALRFSQSKINNPQSAIAFVGSGGKSTALFQLARQLTLPVIVTATTHLHVDQIRLADSHWSGEKPKDFTGFEENMRGVMLVTGSVDGNRTKGLDKSSIHWLRDVCGFRDLTLLVEADGSRQRPLKAPAEHEPVIPEFVTTVVVVAGLSGIGRALTDEFVHHPGIFARLSGLAIGAIITSEPLVRVLTHPEGGLKNIPPGARRVVLLNQADTPELHAQASGMIGDLLESYDAVVIASLGKTSETNIQYSVIHAVHERVAGIVLAAGESSRFGSSKQLLDYHGKPFVRQVAETALTSGLSSVVIVTGAQAEQVEAVLHDLPVTIQRNPNWRTGQSSSMQAGLRLLPQQTGASIFLLADQPQLPPTILHALGDEHARTLAPIIAPLVDGQRANPVLFDRATFPDLMSLRGDMGGRAIFSKYPVNYLTWQDESILLDVDTPEAYRKLIHGE